MVANDWQRGKMKDHTGEESCAYSCGVSERNIHVRDGGLGKKKKSPSLHVADHMKW